VLICGILIHPASNNVHSAITVLELPDFCGEFAYRVLSDPSTSRSNASSDNREVQDFTPSSELRADLDRKRKQEAERELGKFSDEIKNRSVPELERDGAELTYEIKLLEVQLTAGLSEYSPRDLEHGYAKVELYKRKVELISLEIQKRKEETA
jgi:hypothetical protein